MKKLSNKGTIDSNINTCLKLVNVVAMRFHILSNHQLYEDVIQAGCYGLTKAANQWDKLQLYRKIAFSSYAYYRILNAISECLASQYLINGTYYKMRNLPKAEIIHLDDLEYSSNMFPADSDTFETVCRNDEREYAMSFCKELRKLMGEVEYKILMQLVTGNVTRLSKTKLKYICRNFNKIKDKRGSSKGKKVKWNAKSICRNRGKGINNIKSTYLRHARHAIG